MRPLDTMMWAREWSPDGDSIVGFAPDDNSLVVIDVSDDAIAGEALTMLEGTAGADDLSWQRLAP